MELDECRCCGAADDEPCRSGCPMIEDYPLPTAEEWEAAKANTEPDPWYVPNVETEEPF